MNHWNEENELKDSPGNNEVNSNWDHDDCENAKLFSLSLHSVELEMFSDDYNEALRFVVPIFLRRGVDIRLINPN